MISYLEASHGEVDYFCDHRVDGEVGARLCRYRAVRSLDVQLWLLR